MNDELVKVFIMDEHSFYAGSTVGQIIDHRMITEGAMLSDVFDPDCFEELEDHVLDKLEVDGVTFRQFIRNTMKSSPLPFLVATTNGDGT